MLESWRLSNSGRSLGSPNLVGLDVDFPLKRKAAHYFRISVGLSKAGSSTQTTVQKTVHVPVVQECLKTIVLNSGQTSFARST